LVIVGGVPGFGGDVNSNAALTSESGSTLSTVGLLPARTTIASPRRARMLGKIIACHQRERPSAIYPDLARKRHGAQAPLADATRADRLGCDSPHGHRPVAASGQHDSQHDC
jgi:hypothetical protein